MANVTARLKDAYFSKTHLGDKILLGRVYDDQHRRFENGALIHTSIVLEEVEPNIFRTRSNNFYQVENWV